MTIDRIPIKNFIMRRFAHPSIQKTVENWRVDPAVLITKLIEYFRDMGIYEVQYGQEKLINDTMLIQLKTSPEILKLVADAKQLELNRARNRHAE